jgi:hypothetical protein
MHIPLGILTEALSVRRSTMIYCVSLLVVAAVKVIRAGQLLHIIPLVVTKMNCLMIYHTYRVERQSLSTTRALFYITSKENKATKITQRKLLFLFGCLSLRNGSMQTQTPTFGHFQTPTYIN